MAAVLAERRRIGRFFHRFQDAKSGSEEFDSESSFRRAGSGRRGRAGQCRAWIGQPRPVHAPVPLPLLPLKRKALRPPHRPHQLRAARAGEGRHMRILHADTCIHSSPVGFGYFGAKMIEQDVVRRLVSFVVPLPPLSMASVDELSRLRALSQSQSIPLHPARHDAGASHLTTYKDAAVTAVTATRTLAHSSKPHAGGEDEASTCMVTDCPHRGRNNDQHHHTHCQRPGSCCRSALPARRGEHVNPPFLQPPLPSARAAQ